MAMRVIIFRKATWNENQKQLCCLQVRRKVNQYVLMSVNRTSLIVLDTAIAIVISLSSQLSLENLDGTIICLTRPRDISTRITDRSTQRPYKNIVTENLGL